MKIHVIFQIFKKNFYLKKIKNNYKKKEIYVNYKRSQTKNWEIVN